MGTLQTKTKKEKSVLEWFTVGWDVQAGFIFYFFIMEPREMEGPLTHKRGKKETFM